MWNKYKIGIKEIVVILIGSSIFFSCTVFNIPYEIIPGTSIEIRAAVLGFVAGLFGPVVGLFTGLLGHFLGDVLFYESISIPWTIAEGISGFVIGWFFDTFHILDGEFGRKGLLNFNMIQVLANAVAWLVAAPGLDIIFVGESLQRVVTQGFFAFFSNAIIIAVVDSAIFLILSRIIKMYNDGDESL